MVYYTIVLKAQNGARGDADMAISIKAARVNAGFTQSEVAERLNKTKNTIVSWESYTTAPDIKTAQAMAKLYGLSVDDIVWDKD